MNRKIDGLLKRESLELLGKSIMDNSVNIVDVNGLYSSAKAFAIADSVKSGIHLVLLPDKDGAAACVNDLYNIIGDENVFFFPTSDVRTLKGTSKDMSAKVQRTAAVSALTDYVDGNYEGKYLLLAGYKEAFEEYIPDRKKISDAVLRIRKGTSVSFEKLQDELYGLGFTRVDFVSRPGEYAVRGGIIDLFSYNNDKPYRLDFFGDDVEDIRMFDANTQHTCGDSIEVLNVYPNITSAEDGSEDYCSVYSILPDDAVIWVSGMDELDEGGAFSHKKVYLSPLHRHDADVTVDFNTSPQPAFNKNFELLASDIKSRRNDGYKVYVMSENRSQIERLRNIFSSFDLSLEYMEYTIQEGFIDHDGKVCLYTDHQIFDRYRRIRLKRTVERSERLTMNDINSFKEGDYIVHIDHGIGRFGGLVKNRINGKVQEAIKLIYRDNDVLFVSVHGLHRISKYRSGDATKPPKINKLGTGNWEKLKNSAKSKVKDIAEDLIRLYSQRRVAKGFAFSPDSFLQQEFESSFQYEETPDQIKAVEAVKRDMESDCPMDRLVCGDVGFGKTEVAMRAAFKAVADNKQVAVLVPTTILALQHYNTFRDRLRNFPCTIDYLSRLRTAKEVADITERLKSGKIDIIIGTHRLLGKNIAFKDLGLLIIDEEQKFGVAAKEALRRLKLSVDTLTLTATPIPRTLQFSLLGARDLSIINTPPPNRLPIQTEIIDFNEDTIRDIINEETGRGGQVFFVHNRVQDIYEVEDIIRRIVPGIKTCVAHGQMDPKELENKIIEYMSGDYDVLIATTIIENGIDIPNTNTIIINQAQNYGLSDLHQLRGRVGRSNRKAYCYLVVPPMTSLSDDAKRRLDAIEAFSDLGSGFNIAMRDLDIRGMGNMLGAEQSGYIAEMGFETYQRILAEAFEEIKGTVPDMPGMKQQDETYVSDCVVDTDLEILIPDSYINITSEKIRLYKELDSISDEPSLQRFIADIEDRFGPIPEEFKQLVYVVRLRMAARERGFEKIVLKNGMLVMYFISNSMSPFYRSSRFSDIIKNIQHRDASRYMLKENNDKLYITVKNVKTIEGAYNLIQKL
ncbi:MAG TPA: transcription-repair coupling factor [Candidatus Coprenecus stercoravium]|uniref:Transcription-repair-coupling factor n=1 Tax=Candidatus Coprenecus stercoravium TaxID=2840735 RepID=A0A9D2GNS1_9BACT|nr:transcription-repair coupling factor [Candidatus Coprenecus stercoravium]